MADPLEIGRSIPLTSRISCQLAAFRQGDTRGGQTLVRYIQAALRRAKYELLADDGSFYGEIPVCNGIYGNATTLEECREQLAEVVEEGILFRIY